MPRRPVPSLLAAALLGLVAALPAGAQTLSEREARAQVASPGRSQVLVADQPFLDAATKKALEQFARKFPYYAAIAVSPGEPASSQLSLGAVNHHSPEAASRAVLAACNKARTVGGPCVIVAQVVPRSYKPGRLTMSVAATEALRGAFRKESSPKGFAISPATGKYGYARGDGARALSICNGAAAELGAQDCRLVVVDD